MVIGWMFRKLLKCSKDILVRDHSDRPPPPTPVCFLRTRRPTHPARTHFPSSRRRPQHAFRLPRAWPSCRNAFSGTRISWAATPAVDMVHARRQSASSVWSLEGEEDERMQETTQKHPSAAPPTASGRRTERRSQTSTPSSRLQPSACLLVRELKRAR